MQDVLAVKDTYQYERGRYTKSATNEVQIYQIDLKNPVLTDIDSVLQMTVFIPEDVTSQEFMFALLCTMQKIGLWAQEFRRAFLQKKLKSRRS